jgi:hypothetical protein
MTILFFQILILIYKIILLEQNIFIVYAMNLCNVFHNAKLLLSILIGAK